MNAIAKRAALLRLAKQRQSDPKLGYSGKYFNLRDFHDGYYECEHVVPWTISACNVDADLMLISQDWASGDFLSRDKEPEQKRLGQVEGLTTNKTLKKMLHDHMSLSFAETYATDAFVFIKPGPMNARIPFADLARSVKAYTLPQINIVRPKMVLCLGSAPFNAIRRVLGLQRMNLFESYRTKAPVHTEYEGVPIFAVAHPGAEGNRAVGGRDVAVPRWQAIGEYFQSIRLR